MKRCMVCCFFLLALVAVSCAAVAQEPVFDAKRWRGNVSCVKVYTQSYDFKYGERVWSPRQLTAEMYYDSLGYLVFLTQSLDYGESRVFESEYGPDGTLKQVVASRTDHTNCNEDGRFIFKVENGIRIAKLYENSLKRTYSPYNHIELFWDNPINYNPHNVADYYLLWIMHNAVVDMPKNVARQKDKAGRTVLLYETMTRNGQTKHSGKVMGYKYDAQGRLIRSGYDYWNMDAVKTILTSDTATCYNQETENASTGYKIGGSVYGPHYYNDIKTYFYDSVGNLSCIRSYKQNIYYEYTYGQFNTPYHHYRQYLEEKKRAEQESYQRRQDSIERAKKIEKIESQLNPLKPKAQELSDNIAGRERRREILLGNIDSLNAIILQIKMQRQRLYDAMDSCGINMGAEVKEVSILSESDGIFRFKLRKQREPLTWQLSHREARRNGDGLLYNDDTTRFLVYLKEGSRAGLYFAEYDATHRLVAHRYDGTGFEGIRFDIYFVNIEARKQGDKIQQALSHEHYLLSETEKQLQEQRQQLDAMQQQISELEKQLSELINN